MNEWLATVSAELGLEPDVLDTQTVLDLTRDVAHSVARPAAPLTAYLLGVAVGQGADPKETARRLSELALARKPADAG